MTCRCRSMTENTAFRLCSTQALALVFLLLNRVEAVHNRERTSTTRKIHSSHKYRASGGGAGVRHAHAAAPKEFVYVYDLPSQFNEDLTDLPVQWHPEQYDYDQVRFTLALLSQIAAPAYILTCPYPCTSALTLCKRPNNGSLVQVLHRHFSKSAVRTEDPEKAQLFFIPVYLGRHYNWFWQQWSAPGKAWDVSRDCQPHHTPSECFWEKWTGAKEVLISCSGMDVYDWQES